MTRPSVSVIVPVYNCERYLAFALDSIYDQAYEPLDVIVVDDGSTDHSADLARSYPVRLIGLTHGGIPRARNAGLDAAVGDLIAFLDADDLWPPGSLNSRVDRLLEQPELDVVTGMMEYFLEPGVEAPPWCRPAMLAAPQVAFLGGLLAWRRVFEQVGGFDTAYEIAEDTEWLARLKDSGINHQQMPDVVRRYRIHDSNTTHHRRLLAPSLVKILKASIDRQRVRNG